MKTTKVKNLEDRNDMELGDSNFIKEFIGKKADSYSSFFVKIKDGDYEEVWGVKSSVPRYTDTAYRIT